MRDVRAINEKYKSLIRHLLIVNIYSHSTVLTGSQAPASRPDRASQEPSNTAARRARDGMIVRGVGEMTREADVVP